MTLTESRHKLTHKAELIHLKASVTTSCLGVRRMSASRCEKSREGTLSESSLGRRSDREVSIWWQTGSDSRRWRVGAVVVDGPFL